MKIVMLSDLLTHYQKALGDSLYKKTEGGYCFVELVGLDPERKKMGFKTIEAPYKITSSQYDEKMLSDMIMDADAVLCGQAPAAMVKERIKCGRLTFRCSERRYKSNLRYIKWPLYSLESMTYNKGYLLCASAYAARDYILSGMKVERCFKWGYFPEFRPIDKIDSFLNERNRKNGNCVKMIWVGRFLDWKHPEMVIKLAQKLKKDKFCFEINLIGVGQLMKKIRKMIVEYDVEDCVYLLGAKSPHEVRTMMDDSDIYLFTSDEGEGWGAVLNESMNSGCAVVASHAPGSVPYLLKDGYNGLVFKSKDFDSFYEKVVYLIKKPEERIRLCKAAYMTIQDEWNADKAADNLIALINSLKKGEKNPNNEGPCSRAEKLNHNWMK